MRILRLIVKKIYFDQIKSGEKRIDYRVFKPYWISRLWGKKYDAVEIKNGYRKDSPRMLFKWRGVRIIDGELTPLGDMKQYAILLGERLE